MTGSDHPISVWFLCKSCGFTFHFQHVDEFLEHKRQVHFSEFEKIRCIVFEEKLDDNQEQYPDQAPESLDSNLFHVDKVELPEGEIECFWEPETLPATCISRIGSISQDSPDGTEHLEDPKLFSSYVLARRLTSLELHSSKGNETGEPSTADCLNKTSWQPVPTIVPLRNDKDKLLGNSASSPSHELYAVNSDQPETSSARSGNSPNHSGFQLQLSSASGSGNSALKYLTNNNISSDQDSLTDVFDISSQAISSLDPSLICNNSSLIDEFEHLAAFDVSEENLDLETLVHNDEINLEPEVAPISSHEIRVKEKRWSDINCNPFVLVKRLKLADCTILPEKDAPSEHSDYDNDDDYQPDSPQDTNGSDSNFVEDESRTINQRRQENFSSRLRVRQGGIAFIFPSPESDSEDANNPLTLKDWLLHQMEITDSNASTNIILLDPDPTKQNIGPVTSEDPLKCKLCSKKLISEPEVKVHVRHCWLLNKSRHRFCVICTKSFTRSRGLKLHNRSIHGIEERKMFQCQYCSEQFEDETSWNRHEKMHPEKTKMLKPFACKLCNKSFRLKGILKVHLIAHSNARPFKCEHSNCHFAAKRLHDLKVHNRSHRNPRSTKCMLPFKFPYFQITERNSESGHVSLADWIAKQTEEVEGTPPNVILLEPDPTKENVGPITQENFISCKLCSEKLTSESRVKVHVTHCWLRNQLRHKYCVACNKSLINRISFRQHCVSIHGTQEEKAKLRRFKCQQCSKTYTNSSDLRIHLETHKSKEEQNRPFVCDACGIGFFRPNDPRYHSQAHSNERPFKCLHPNCTEAFKTKAGRRSHMRRHSDSRPHQCQYPGCSKAFKTNAYLKEHSLLHQDKRYECTHGNCKEKFLTSYELKRHLKIRHAEEGIAIKFQCNVCHKIFAKNWSLMRHAAIHL